MDWGYATYATCPFAIVSSGRLTQVVLAHGCFAALTFPAGSGGIVKFTHPAAGASCLLAGVGKVFHFELSHMFEATLDLLLFSVAHIERDVIQLFLGE